MAERCRCEHGADEHSVGSICQELIHFACEDLPCVCERRSQLGEEACPGCSHATRQHLLIRKGSPRGGVLCGCVGPIDEASATTSRSQIPS